MSKIVLTEEAGVPSTPAAGKWTLYTKAGGLYYLDDAGTEIGPITAGTLLSKAAAADIATGTDDAKYVTSLGIKNSVNVPNVAPSTSGNVLTSNGTAWTSATPSLSAIYLSGWMINGKLSVTVASNNLTVAVKTLAGADPSAGDPVNVRIGNVVHSITSALSITKNAGTNYCNAGGAELATVEVDYFVYLGYNATDGVVIGFSRIPYSNQYSTFSATSTNGKYAAISTITNAAATDYYDVVGRFAATLSAGAGYTWSVPTYTATNLISRPIFETRFMSYVPTLTGWSSPPTSTSYRYQIKSDIAYLYISQGVATTSNTTGVNLTLPLYSATVANTNWTAAGQGIDNGASAANPCYVVVVSNASSINVYKNYTPTAWTASGNKGVEFSVFYNI